MDYLLQEGDVLDKYCIERCLGAGGMGAVYLARHTQLNALRALKVLHTDIADDDPEFRERFAREARFAAKVQHPNIIAVMDVETESPSGFSYIVMEYVEGHSISQLLKNGPLPEAQAVFIIRETAKALAYAAESGIVHRDIKPANIMITTDGHVKLADLGIAKCSDASGERFNTLTMEGTMMGTPAYASPEQCRDARSVDTRADIYSLGATLYEMLTGQSAFSGTNAFDIMVKVIRTNPVPVLQLNPEITPELAALVEKMMQKDPANRPQTMLDLLNEIYVFDLPDVDTEMTPMLQKMIEERAEEVVQERVSAIMRSTRKTQKIKRISIISLTALLLIVVAVLGVQIFISEDDHEKQQSELEAEQKRLAEEKAKIEAELKRAKKGNKHLELDLTKIEADKKLGVKFSDSNTTLISYPKKSPDNTYVIPDGVTGIGDGAFFGCTKLQRITIPDSVTSIGERAFEGCFSLQSITIPDSVTSIGERAFEDCRSLQSITIPNGVTSIGSCAFLDCTKLQRITIPNSVTSIGERAFSGCSSLQSITIPDSVPSIGYYAFYGCSSLQSITIPNSVTSIGERAFAGCRNLQKITIPNSVTSIGDGAFAGCRNLQKITIPDSVTSIGAGAFYGCFSLQSITIPDSVTSIGERAFEDCRSLQSITIPKHFTDQDIKKLPGSKIIRR